MCGHYIQSWVSGLRLKRPEPQGTVWIRLRDFPVQGVDHRLGFVLGMELGFSAESRVRPTGSEIVMKPFTRLRCAKHGRQAQLLRTCTTAHTCSARCRLLRSAITSQPAPIESRIIQENATIFCVDHRSQKPGDLPGLPNPGRREIDQSTHPNPTKPPFGHPAQSPKPKESNHIKSHQRYRWTFISTLLIVCSGICKTKNILESWCHSG